MDIILWRHADAFEMREVVDDMDRALTPKGERQAQRMATWLNRLMPANARVLVSLARRAQQTATALDRKFKTTPLLGPLASVDDLLLATRWPDARETVLVVGHQPVLGLTAAYLLSGEAHPWPVRKAGVMWLRVRDREDQRQVLLHAVMSPELMT